MAKQKNSKKKEKDPLLSPIKLVSIVGVYGTAATLNQATVTLDVRGQHQTAQEKGVGPVAAIGHAIQKIYPHDAKLTKFRVLAETDGLDAKGEVHIALTIPAGGTFEGTCSDPDIMIGIATAYLNALNELCEFLEKRDRRLHGAEHPNGNLRSQVAI